MAKLSSAFCASLIFCSSYSVVEPMEAKTVDMKPADMRGRVELISLLCISEEAVDNFFCHLYVCLSTTTVSEEFIDLVHDPRCMTMYSDVYRIDEILKNSNNN